MLTATATLNADPDYNALILKYKQIRAGMTYGHVLTAWGEPTKVDRVSNTEYWYMKNHWLVIFENGKVRNFYYFDPPQTR